MFNLLLTFSLKYRKDEKPYLCVFDCGKNPETEDQEGEGLGRCDLFNSSSLQSQVQY